MSEWNIPKIREECLKLMGWTPSSYVEGASTYTHWHADETVKLDREDSTQFPPDPTTSLDDALPLMERYDISPFRTHDGMWAASKPCCRAAAEAFENVTYEEQVANRPALAICLVALRCAGHDLDDFRVKT